MSETPVLARENLAYLQQGLDLLDRLSDESYTRSVPPMSGSSLGEHYRHALDHYLRFIEGWRGGLVDYDARAREVRLEKDRAYARQQTRQVMESLGAVGEADIARALEVLMACDRHETGRPERTMSTVGRELQFLISHTVHHFALIAVILRLEGREPPADFGVAPSTLKHRQSPMQCAP